MSKVPKLRFLATLFLMVPLLALGLSTVIAPQASAAEDTPGLFIGDVYVDTEPVVFGTAVRVLEDSEVLGTTTTGIYGEAHHYSISLENEAGTLVSFEVFWGCDGGAEWVPAAETATHPAMFGLVIQDLTITCGPTPPTVTTTGADPDHNSATLNGNLVDMGEYDEVKVRFEYGTSISYGQFTGWSTKTSSGLFIASVGGLTPATLYHFMAVAETVLPSDTVTDLGGDLTFTTSVGPDWPRDVTLDAGLNVISTPVWLDSDEDTVADIIPTGTYTWAYRWTGTSFTTLASYYVWTPLEAFYVYVDAGTVATFTPTTEMKAPNKRTFSSNRWYLIGSSPDDGDSTQTMDIVLAGLKDNYSNVIKPGINVNDSADSCACNTQDPCTGLTLPAFGGAWVHVGDAATKTIVGFYGFTPVLP